MSLSNYRQTTAVSTVVLSKYSVDSTGALYKVSAQISPGVYWYTYTVKNTQYANGYLLAQSSFVVTARPSGVTNINIPDAKVVTNGKVQLTWTCAEPNVSYKVYAGKDVNNLTLVYNLATKGTVQCHSILSGSQ